MMTYCDKLSGLLMPENFLGSEQAFQDIIKIAKHAGAAVMEIYSESQNSDESKLLIEHKEDNSPVTSADLASHRIIVKGLLALTPDIPVVSEEDPDSLVQRKANQTFWLIDPLDGTKEFLSRNGEFTINIALIVDGHAVWGVVNAPALDVTYWGGANFGAKRETDGQTQSMQVNKSELQPLRVVASKSHLNKETQGYISSLGVVELIQAGSSLKFCRIAEGIADLYPRLAPTCEWDTAAAQAVLEGAGGHVFDLAGNMLRYGKPNVLNPSFIASATPSNTTPFAPAKVDTL